MLVCNISMRAPRRAIAVDIAEVAAALDATTTGTVVFAALVDDPASVGDFVDAYLGEIMVEPASATDTIACGLAYAGDLAEASTSTDTTNADITPAGAALATFDGVPSHVTLSNGNLTATNSDNNGGGARSASLKTTGKYYFEITVGQTSQFTSSAGILASTGTYNDMLVANAPCSFVTLGSGTVWSGGSSYGSSIGAVVATNVVGVAIDLDNRKAWFRRNGGNWLGQAIGSQNPATNTGGAPIPTGSFAPAVAFNGTTGDNMTGNFGQGTFGTAAPSGFSNWPA